MLRCDSIRYFRYNTISYDMIRRDVIWHGLHTFIRQTEISPGVEHLYIIWWLKKESKKKNKLQSLSEQHQICLLLQKNCKTPSFLSTEWTKRRFSVPAERILLISAAKPTVCVCWHGKEAWDHGSCCRAAINVAKTSPDWDASVIASHVTVTFALYL